jgi:LPXTG-motif cell wall-anchored protein
MVAAPATIPVPAWLQNLIGKQVNMMMVAGAAGGVLLLLLGGGFFLWRRRKKKAGTATIDSKGQLSSPAADAEKEMQARLAEQAAEQQRLEAEAILSLKLPAVSTKRTDVLTKHIAQEVKKDPAAMAHVVRSWLNGEYKR